MLPRHLLASRPRRRPATAPPPSMTQPLWYCPLCQNEGGDPNIVFCRNDGARLKPIAERGAEWIGQVIDDKYRIVRFVDAGGTAEVYEAERLGTDKRVALKLLHAALAANAEAMERFLQEAQLVSLIAHPNVVAIQDFGTLPSAVHYMVMELLDGQPLSLVLAQDPPTPLTALKYAMQAAEGLAAAHERGVVHCDIKPSNLFLQRASNGDEPVVKILDLGIGRLLAGRSGELAESSAVAGTPDYMAPEQILGQPLGPAVDIYAMGIVVYEMLLGRLPFSDPSYVNVLSKHVHERARWPADVATLRGLPPEIGEVVLRALAKDPEARQGSMIDLQHELAAVAGQLRGAGAHGPASRAHTLPSMPGRKPTPGRIITRPPMSVRSRTASHAATMPAGANMARVPLAHATGGDHEIAEVAPDVYWVGRRHGATLECNSYLRVFRKGHLEVSLLTDPGPPQDLEVVLAKVSSVIGSIRRLDYIFLNHQDPDVASNAAAIQQASPRAQVLCSIDTWRLAQFYGLDRKRFTGVESFAGGRTALATGHELIFVPTPFCHFRGATMLYDPESRVLFSGDLFGGADAPTLVATEACWPGVEMFHQIYMPSARALGLAVARIRRLTPPPHVVAPQHGALIVGADVVPLVESVGSLQVGLELMEANDDPRFVDAGNDILKEYRELAGADQVRELLAAYGGDQSFTSLFSLDGPERIAAIKVAPRLALDALAGDALANLPAARRGALQRSIRVIWRQHGLDATGAAPTSARTTRLRARD